ncbi:MAG TPA: lysophospholipid acyltransferase family protein [bacterium]|nr:lysophospholipid acyltransferase family protein [bacterium]
MRLRWMVGYAIVYAFGRMVLKVRVSGRNKLVPGPQILASNHVCNFDPLLVGLGARREIHFLAKEELFKASRWFDWLIRTYNAWPVRRGGADAGAIRSCSWLLERRQTIVLFPEGTRSKTGDINGFKPGVGMLAISNHVPVVPVHLGGVSRSIISYLVDRDFVKRGYRKKPTHNEGIRIAFADPVYPDGFAADRQGYEELTQEVENRVRELAAKSEARN